MNIMNTMIVADIADFGSNAKSSVLPQISDLIIVALVVGIVLLVLKRKLVAAIGTLIGGGILVYIVNNSDLLSTWGGQLIKFITG